MLGKSFAPFTFIELLIVLTIAATITCILFSRAPNASEEEPRKVVEEQVMESIEWV